MSNLLNMTTYYTPSPVSRHIAWKDCLHSTCCLTALIVHSAVGLILSANRMPENKGLASFSRL